MSPSAAPPVPRVAVTLSLPDAAGGRRIVDLATRALVVAVVPAPRFAREAEVLAAVAAAADAGADLAEVPAEPRLLGPAAASGVLPVVARVTTPEAARSAQAAGAALGLVPDEAFASVADGSADSPASVGDAAPTELPLAVVVETARAGRDAVVDHPSLPVVLDISGLSGADAVSEESLALAVGVRLIRTSDLRRTRRVVEVMAHLLDSRR